MKFKLVDKKSIILTGLFLVVFYVSFLATYYTMMQQTYKALEHYIKTHQGSFPKSKVDFKDVDEVYIPNESVFQIRYGTELKDVIISEGRLVGGDNHELFFYKAKPQYVFFDFWFKKTHRVNSLKLYDLMKRENETMK